MTARSLRRERRFEGLFDTMLIIYVLGGLSLATSFLVETSSWWIRGYCAPGEIGRYVSRSNIYLYFGRFFALIFNAAIAFQIERGASSHAVATALALAFAASALTHALLLRGGRATGVLLRGVNASLLLPQIPAERHDVRHGVNWTIVGGTAFASFCFTLGIALPLLLAVFVPSYRMSLSYVGQVVNAVGTLMLLFLIDQRLFRSLDAGVLDQDLPSYSLGRIAAFGLAALVCYGVGALA